MAGIFISYRRDDSAGHAGRLFDHLKFRFGVHQVFMDVCDIQPGSDFVDVINRAVGSCDVLLAVIGHGWLVGPDGTKRRLDVAHDFIGLEISTALARKIRIIPILVEGAQMPAAADLPEGLRPFTRRQAVELRHSRWDDDVEALVHEVELVLCDQTKAAPMPQGLIDLGNGAPSSTSPGPLSTGTRFGAAALALLFVAAIGYVTMGRPAVVEPSRWVPDVMQWPWRDAYQQVTDHGFRVTVKFTRPNGSAEPGTVIGQSPVAWTGFPPPSATPEEPVVTLDVVQPATPETSPAPDAGHGSTAVSPDARH
ncbi:MAG: TIR domain-containing protein [Vicinamibacterales bacterium]